MGTIHAVGADTEAIKVETIAVEEGLHVNYSVTKQSVQRQVVEPWSNGVV